MADEYIHDSSRSLKHKLRSSMTFSWCFGNNVQQVRPTLVHTSSLNSKNRRVPPHLKDKRHNFISRFGRNRRLYSVDFHYDALSYSLNFEDDANGDSHFKEQYAYVGSFSSRVPQSPSPTPSTPPASVTIWQMTSLG